MDTSAKVFVILHTVANFVISCGFAIVNSNTSLSDMLEFSAVAVHKANPSSPVSAPDTLYSSLFFTLLPLDIY
jgi:hypothetical protein